MKCAELQRHFDEYLDQECAPEIRELIDEHLTGCADCRAEMASRKAFHAAFAGLVEEELPCDFNAVGRGGTAAAAQEAALSSRLGEGRRSGRLPAVGRRGHRQHAGSVWRAGHRCGCYGVGSCTWAGGIADGQSNGNGYRYRIQ